MFFGSDLHITSRYGAVDTLTNGPSADADDASASQWKWSPILRHHWKVQWSPQSAPDAHVAVSLIEHDFRLFSKFPFIVMTVEAKQVSLVYIYSDLISRHSYIHTPCL